MRGFADHSMTVAVKHFQERNGKRLNTLALPGL